MRKETYPQNEMLKGTLDMMILRTPVGGDAHGHTIARVIEHTPKIFWRWSRAHYIRRCIGSRTEGGFLLPGV
jgi:hypothetical protein